MNPLTRIRDATLLAYNALFNRTTIFYDMDGRIRQVPSNMFAFVNEGYKANQHVFSIIDRIATDAGAIPVFAKKKNKRTGEVTIIDSMATLRKDQKFHDLVFKCNDTQGLNYELFTRANIIFKLLTGNTINYNLIPVGFQEVTKRYTMAPQYTTVDTEQVEFGYAATKYHYPVGKQNNLEPERILHIKNFDPDLESQNNFMGMSPLQAAYLTLIADNETNVAWASMIKNRGAIGMLSNDGKRALKSGEKELLDEELKGRVGGGLKANKIVTTSGSFKFIPFQMSPVDLQILEKGVFNLRDLASIYKTSSRLFNDPAGTTYNNAREDIKQHYNNAVLPELKIQNDRFNEETASTYNDNTFIYYTEYDTSGIEALQEDQNKKVAKDQRENQIIRDIIAGINVDYSLESAVQQMMRAINVDEDEAKTIIGTPIRTDDGNNN